MKAKCPGGSPGPTQRMGDGEHTQPLLSKGAWPTSSTARLPTVEAAWTMKDQAV